MIRERERQREIIQEEMRLQKRLGNMTAKEVRAIKATMDSFITNDLSSHLAQAIQLHFGAFPIAQNIAQYFQENPISSIPPPHEQHQEKIFPSGCLTLPPDGPSAILASGTSGSSLLRPVRPIPPYLGNFASQAFSHSHPPTVSFSIPPDVFSPPGRNPPFRPLPSRTL